MPRGVQIPKGSTAFISLSDAKALAKKSIVTSLPLLKAGMSVAQCYQKATTLPAEMCKANTQKPKELFDECRRKEDQATAQIHLMQSKVPSTPAEVCLLSGVAEFSMQKNYANENVEPEPGLVALLPMTVTSCFPMRAMQFVGAHAKTGELIVITLEPQGVLRVHTKANSGEAVAIDLNGIWWHPDVLSRFSTMGQSTSTIFPQSLIVQSEKKNNASRRVKWICQERDENAKKVCVKHKGSTCSKEDHPCKKYTRQTAEHYYKQATGKYDTTLQKQAIYNDRKGLVKDAILYNPGKANKCGCWVQKRLICSRMADGGFQCDQKKRVVRKILMDNNKMYLPSTMDQCIKDDTTGFCLEECVNRLLAL